MAARSKVEARRDRSHVGPVQALGASGAAEALAAAARHEGGLDLMIIDVVMPGINGRELADRMRSARPGLRVLFASGYTESPSRRTTARKRKCVSLRRIAG